MSRESDDPAGLTDIGGVDEETAGRPCLDHQNAHGRPVRLARVRNRIGAGPAKDDEGITGPVPGASKKQERRGVVAVVLFAAGMIVAVGLGLFVYLALVLSGGGRPPTP